MNMTPMMKQYMEIKKQHLDCLLFFRMGDFYELFLEDAHIGAKVLDITLTGKSNGKNDRIPMAGVPYHAVDSYLAKLVKAGYKVAICEQVSEPNKYGIVDREVIRIVTPGTVLDEKTLEKKENNFIISIFMNDKHLGFAAADISTGQFQTCQFVLGNAVQILSDELSRLRPAECILHHTHYNNPQLLKTLSLQKGLNIYCFHDWDTITTNAKSYLKNHFGVNHVSVFGLEDKPLALEASAALLGYIRATQKNHIHHFKTITSYSNQDYMLLDKSTMINLELFSTIRDNEKKGSLISVLDHTMTAMGGRMLRDWIRKPLINKDEITKRHDAVQLFLEEHVACNNLREELGLIADIERIIARLSVGIGNAKDLYNLKKSLQVALSIKKQLNQKTLQKPLIKTICDDISKEIDDVVNLIDMYIVDDPPFDVKTGGIIKKNLSDDLDKLRRQISTLKEWLLNFETEEKQKTGISSLKVRFNQVFGFYIEVSKSNLHLAPKHYYRKQTLVNGERFITPELKEKEELILTAEEKINDIEFKLFCEVLKKVLQKVVAIQQTAQSIAVLDCILNFAYIAEKKNYTRPQIKTGGAINITAGRHPVVEQLLEEKQFVPNDVLLNQTEHQLLLITGPNMAGKSVYIRQVALIVLLAQIGCFVPAEQAEISVVDRIYVRSGASDVITSGLSTFMVEMVETAHILNHATKNSLIIMDEIGRGTSTYDGISIAWAIAEYLVTNKHVAAKTLFATHYHELQELEKHYPEKIKNYHMAIEEKDGQPIFLHTILRGGASHSFGVAVAKLAGVPKDVVKKAKELLPNLEKRDVEKQSNHTLNVEADSQSSLQLELQKINIHNITPLEALNILAELKKKI
jgi:DNA mismatch repair protein MutS